MKIVNRFLVIALAVIIAMAFSACSKKATEFKPIEGEVTELATNFVGYLAEGNFKAASEFFDEEMLKLLPDTELSKLWDQLQKQVGSYEHIVGQRDNREQIYDVVYVTTQFEQALIDLKVVFNSDKRIAGFFFVPAKMDTASYNVPDYVDSSSFTEKEVVFGEDEWRLPGTLTIPKGEGPFPAVILVHGSGPNDRDETIGPSKPFKDLAWGLGSQGIAVFRYDKRTLVHNQRMASLNSMTVNEETVFDAQAAVSFLKGTENIDISRIIIIGHSLGGMLAPRIAEGNKDIAGLIILAGAARPLEDLILEQIKYIAEADGSISKEEESNIRLIESHISNIKDPNLSPETSSSELFGIPASYWLDLREYNPVVVAKNLPIPMLILQGERDYQVTMEDFNMWKSASSSKNNVEFKTYPRLNHLFIEGEGKSLPDEYMVAGNVYRGVIDDIALWVKNKK